MNRRLVVLCLVLAGVGAASSGWAKTKDLNSGLKIQGFYDSNLFFDDRNRKSDFVSLFAPYIEQFVRAKRGFARFYAEPQFLVYAKNDDLNDVHFDLIGNSQIELTKNWALQLDSINRRSITTYISDDAVGATGRFDYNTNAFSTGLAYDSKKGTQGSVRYNFDRIYYKEPAIADSDGRELEILLEQKVSDLFYILSKASYEERHFDSGFEPNILLGAAGFRYLPNRRISHEFLAGLEDVDQYETGSSSDEFYYSYEFVWQVTRKDKLSFKSRKYSGIIDSRDNLLGLWQQTLSWVRKLSRHDSVKVALSTLRSTYDLLSQKEHFYKADIVYERELSRFCSLKIEYAYDLKDADEPSTEYNRHVVFAGFTFKF